MSAVLALAFIAATCFGCASQSKKESKLAAWDVRRAWTKEEEKPEPQVPSRLVATWTETVLSKAGQKPLRGFGGRIAFFKQASEDPVRVDGQLVVYAFDETSRASHETHPTRKYIFPADQVVRHESESKVGPSYSFWLPWDEAGGPQRNISLIARFEPKDGPIVIGEQTKHFLPGSALDASTPQLAEEASAVVNSVRLAAYSKQAEEVAADAATPLSAVAQQESPAAARPQMSTTTIPLPRRLGASLSQQVQKADSNTTMYDSRAAGDVPLSQLSAMRREQPEAPATTPAAESAAPAEETATLPRSPANSRQPLREVAAARGAGLQRSQGSLRESLPVQARRSGPTVHGRDR
jgi:hypothetical protein